LKDTEVVNKSYNDTENYRRYYNDWFKQKNTTLEKFLSPSTKLFDIRRKFILDIAKDVTKKGGKNILDLGCGEETYIENLVKINNNNFYGVDISDFVIDLHKKAYQDYSNVEFIACPAEKLPFNKEYFDLIICDELIEHVPKAEILLDEIKRIIKKDGILIISTPNRNRISAIFKKLVPQKLLNKLSSNPMNSINPLLQKHHDRIHYHEHEFSLGELIKLLRRKKFITLNMIKTTMILFPPKLYDKLVSNFPTIDQLWRNIDSKTIHSLPSFFKVNMIVVSKKI
jgi:2-polyprenyl-3-methyl-5-hydroxy-6-metoxy-1,4-benzoquinol methylase